jgi:TANFOR domain-containing protein
MYTPFNMNKTLDVKPIAILLILFISGWFFPTTGIGQFAPVRVNITVTPPYSTKLSDYTNNPNKLLATLQNFTMDGVTLRVYLRGEITGASGTRIYTSPNFRPAQPIVLQPGMPFMLNVNNIQDVFDAHQLVYQGITQQEIIYGNGLPEDDYIICLSVYDYDNDMLLSDEPPFGCSVPFTISNIEAPVITQPFCHEHITPLTPQNIIISWTMPAGAPPTTQYRLRMVEVSPSGHDPNDAIVSQPPFFETTVTGNVFLYGPAQPALVEDKTYAFVITAFDPMGQLVFRNGGRSEVCSFTWGKFNMGVADTFQPTTLIPKLPDDYELAPPTSISGRLMVKYPTNPYEPFDMGAIPFFTDPITIPAGSTGQPAGDPSSTIVSGAQLNFSYAGISHMGTQLSGNINNHPVGNAFMTPDPNDAAVHSDLYAMGWPLIAKMKTRRFVFADSENLQYTKPLANVQIRLVARYAIINHPDVFGIQHGEYGVVNPLTKGIDLNGAFRGDGNKYANVTLYETHTDENGDFSFDFSLPFFTGPIMTTGIDHAPPATADQNPLGDIFGAVVFPGVDIQNVSAAMTGMPAGSVNAPAQQKVMSMSGAIMAETEFGYLCLKIEVVNQKFCSPDIDIFAMPGDNIIIPAQVAKLKTYNLTVEVKSDSTANQMNPPGQALRGVKVEVLRRWNQTKNEIPQILDYEGQRLGTKIVSSKGEFRQVSFDTTGVSGIVRFENLVRHGYINPQYLLDLSVRNFDAADSAYDLSFYNYRDIFTEVPSVAQNNAFQSFQGQVLYNHQYQGPEEIVARYSMTPLPPEIKGRVMAHSDLENIGIPDVGVTLLNQSSNTRLNDYNSFLSQCYYNVESNTETNPSGFFRFTDLPVRDKNGNPIYRRILVRPKLYSQQIWPRIGPINEQGRLPLFIRLGELIERVINLEPLSMMAGYVEDEDGEPVVAYVKSAQSPYYKTETKVIAVNPANPLASKIQEQFNVPADPQGTATITVEPLSSMYFPRDTTLLPQGQGVRVRVYKRLHRPAITVRNQQGLPVAGAVVNIGGHIDTTNAAGKVWMKFAAAADQFVMRITPPAGYSPVQQPVNIPVSADWKPYSFTLGAGKSIKGLVTSQPGNQPVAGAKVFAELVSTNGLPLYIEAITNAQGAYTLTGIPRATTQLVVQVVKEGNTPSYIGTTRTISFPAQVPTQPQTENFTLQRADDWDLSQIWGFPIVVTALNNRIIPGTTTMGTFLSGYLINPPTAAGFATIQDDMKIPFQGIRINKGPNNRPEPANGTLQTNALEIPVQVGEHYAGHLYNYGLPTSGSMFVNAFGFCKKNLKLDKVSFGTGGGRISGQVKLDLASFKLVNNFTGILYVGNDTVSGKATVFSSTLVGMIGTEYSVFSLNNNLQPVPVRNYRVFNFNASATLTGSALRNGVIRLETILHTNVPGGGTNSSLDLKMRAGNLVINNTDIRFEQTPGGQLTFELDKWKVSTTKPWRFDVNENAIILEEVLIITGRGVDARVRNMRVRPNALTEGEISLSGGITLGGIATVELPPQVKPIFNYDAGIRHYSISLIGGGNRPAGTVRNLRHTVPSHLVLESISMLSNQSEVISVDEKMTFYDIIQMEVNGIMSGPGFFALKGVPIVGIPGYDPPSAIVRYERKGNQITPTVEPLIGTVFCHGNVEFELAQTEDKQQTTPGKLTSYGMITIKPAPDDPAGEPIQFAGFLTKTKTLCEIEIIKVNSLGMKGNTMQLMPAGQNQLPVEKGSMAVEGNKWKPLTYTCLTHTVDGMGTTGKQANQLDLTVHGGIAVNSDNVSVTGINTPLGNLNLTYDFAEGSMVGNLNVKNLYLGYATIFDGGATVRFDKKGFYFLLNMQDFALANINGFKGGLLIGSTKGVEQTDLTDVRSNFRYTMPPFQSGFTGIYMIGEKKIADYNLPLIVMTAKADVGLGMNVNLNFHDKPDIEVAGYAYCDLLSRTGFGIPATGVECGVWADAKLHSVLKGEYKGGNYGINHCGSLEFNFGFDKICGTVLKELDLEQYLAIITNLVNMRIDAGYNSASGFTVDVTPFKTCN